MPVATDSRSWLDALAVLLSAAATFAAASTWSFWPAGCVALVPILVRTQRAGRTLVLATVALGLALAACWYPVTDALEASFGFGLLARHVVLALVVLWHVLPYALLLAICQHAARKGTSLCVLAPLLVVPLEQWYPWLFQHHLGLMLVDCAPFLQIAEIGGAAAASSLLLLLNCAIADLVRNRRVGRTQALAAAITAVVAIWGAIRATQVAEHREQAPVLPVALLSPNYGRITRELQLRSGSSIVAGMRRAGEDARLRGARLVVWPEAVWPYAFDRRLTAEPQPEHPWAFRRVREHHLVVGALTCAGEEGGPFYNSVLWFGSGGELVHRHDKRALIPGFEYGPCGDWFGYGPRFRARFPEWPLIEPGTESERALPAGPLRLGLLCCSEELERGTALRQVEVGANLLVACSSDAWFQNADIAAQHEAFARFRAVECRRDYVRAVHAGHSCAIAATGATIAATRYEPRADQAVQNVPTSVHAEVRLLDDPPLAAWTVGLCLWTCVLASLAVVGVPLFRLRAQPVDPAMFDARLPAGVGHG